MLGIGLYGLTYLYPLYLAEIRGYDALMIGETMFVSGVAMFLTAPIAGRLMTKVDPRFMLMAGFLCFAVGTWWMTYLTKDWDFWELFWPQMFRGVGLMLGDDPDQQHGARHAAAGAGEERLGPVQPDAQPRRRGRARRHSPPSSTTAPTCIWRACTRGITWSPRSRRSRPWTSSRYPKLVILALISLECQQPRSHISASSGIAGGKP